MPSIQEYLNRIRNSFSPSAEKSHVVAFIDTEVSADGRKVYDFGAFIEPEEKFHAASKDEFAKFIRSAEYLCGHNILHHDLKYLAAIPGLKRMKAIDTLYLSPLLFPRRPYHKLLKDDKLQVEEVNNPLNDSLKARDLFYDEISAFNNLSKEMQSIYYKLLHRREEFEGFFDFIGFEERENDLAELIQAQFKGLICDHADISRLVSEHPTELAYALALIHCGDTFSITPPWVLYHFPLVERVLKLLCDTPCHQSCSYCEERLDIHKNLQSVFGYNEFRTFDGEPMQEKAVQAAVDGKSLLTIFPTGGGKSLTFQLPAIMAGRNEHGLTVVISPLQSLMKDQVDNLAEKGITEAVTINGLLDPISRTNAFERVADGSASMLYIAPEMLRSKTLEKLLLSRNVVRFVIDEAHCFSAWGHDFRVDYLYIGDFIRKIQEKKGNHVTIPVSCFTATAKQKVISDIRDYFQRKLGLELELFASTATRTNLRYSVIYAETEEEKYDYLRNLLTATDYPTIIYVSPRQKTREIAEKLTSDGFPALPFNGKMDPNDKIANQNAFMDNQVRAIVATSAFGMGVDKKDVGMVIHYDISDSLENYVQEAGRAGRDPQLNAQCYILFSDHDLDKHFFLLNQTKLSISEIQQVWKAIKDLTRQRKSVSCSALEIARQAGWNDSVSEIETRVRTAIAALEEAGYIKRGNNVPRVFATGIMVKNMDDARKRIENSSSFSRNEQIQAIRIIKSLISNKHKENAGSVKDKGRVDYLADMLGMTKAEVIQAVSLMRQEGILADSRDMSAFIHKSDNEKLSLKCFEIFAKLEQFLLAKVRYHDNRVITSYKELNEQAAKAGIPKTSTRNIRTILNFLSIKSYIKKHEDPNKDVVLFSLNQDYDLIWRKNSLRIDLCRFIIEKMYASLRKEIDNANSNYRLVQFSVIELQKSFSESIRMNTSECTIGDVEEALLYLSKIGALKLEGGFMVIYNAMQIHRLTDMKHKYKKEDYRLLDEFYKQKIRQIHIVGEYANLMVKDYGAALQFVQDYFLLDHKKFISRYFKGDRAKEIEKNITTAKYRQLFGELSEKQREIIQDKQSKCIVVAAGPGSGKTRVLVHKLASLLLMEDVKHEQLLMLTFSRAAAIEFKQRLIKLIGGAAHFVDIMTFHSYSFDLIGKMGNLEDMNHVVRMAADMIENGEVEPTKIGKTVLVIDEAQDMDADEYALVSALMRQNEEMRVIAVGDDDQNIYQFRGSDSKYMQSFISDFQAVQYEMTENYRSCRNIVQFSDRFIHRLDNRMKKKGCTAISQENGQVFLTKHISSILYTPIINQLKHNGITGTVCVMTNTNDEAVQMAGLLHKEGFRTKLIQSGGSFRLADLAEIRYFLKQIDKRTSTPIISDALWKEAKEKTLLTYSQSNLQEYLQGFFHAFESTNKVKYRSDLGDFVFESNIEDFCFADKKTVLVSTIHKTKGREFDTVYMMLARNEEETAENIRKLYVGMTRARKSLYIHTCTAIFDGIRRENMEYAEDHTLYDAPNDISVQLTHRDVYLDFFKDKKEKILSLRSGQPLWFKDNGFYSAAGDCVGVLSAKKRNELQELYRQGFTVYAAEVAFVAAWRGENDTVESAVMLPRMQLRR